MADEKFKVRRFSKTAPESFLRRSILHFQGIPRFPISRSGLTRQSVHNDCKHLFYCKDIKGYLLTNFRPTLTYFRPMFYFYTPDNFCNLCFSDDFRGHRNGTLV